MKRLAGNAKEWLERIADWVQQQQDIFYLSSCGQPDAGDLGDYELIVAQGIRNRYLLDNDHNCDVDWPEIQAFCNRDTWTFFVLSYDLNRHLTTGLEQHQRDVLGWPLLYLVEPERVITVSKAGEVDVFADDMERFLRELTEPAYGRGGDILHITHGQSYDSMSRREHYDKIVDIKEQIACGSFYEINLCVETVIEDIVISNPFALHQRLLALSPTPFSSYVQLGDMHLLSASPERFLKKKGRRIASQPIKGTSARYASRAEDEASKQYLSQSLKERAEHVMIVDLMRNDLGRLCETGSISVPELCGIYGYRQVYHMISTITGECRENTDFTDVLRATFPMGSMTGAPKHIVMQYIEQIEGASRGWFSGSVGYIKPNGDFDSNVVIRSVFYDAGQCKAKYSVGGAITFDSDPDAEYNECLLKSSAIRHLLYRNKHSMSA